MPKRTTGEASRSINPTHSDNDVDVLVSPDNFNQGFSDDDSFPSASEGLAEGFSGQADLDSIRRLSVHSLHHGRTSPVRGSEGHPAYALQPTLSSRVVKVLRNIWDQNRGVVLVAVSQLFGALMNLAARVLQVEAGMHPFQVLFARQSLTMLGAVIYMWWTKTPDFPFGAKEVRWLLLVRGVSGFFGIYCLWSSMRYLPLAEATVITFLAPSIAGIACYVAFREPFTRVEQVGTLVAFVGVVFIARPASLFSGLVPEHEGPDDGGGGPDTGQDITPGQRLQAVGVNLLGVLGAAGAYATIRWIGKRAHALVSVNYFATICTVMCLAVLTMAPVLGIGQPELRFALPQGARQWSLLVFLGLMGFIMQFLMTAGLRVDRSNRANAMMFTHMIFAAAFDRWVFGATMGWTSLVGSGLIIGGALYMVLCKDKALQQNEGADIEAAAAARADVRGAGDVRDSEAVPMLMDVDRNDSTDDEDEESALNMSKRSPQRG
ncbi:hypothetical protein SODALDRAFT_326640 [Sodiomyces alkalinus F11]|uniref:EamA domain-containing protein n=1 Tax=Sodiomyces alkalinus (strain CBS 110278 / VKM F-3762 / F11) TaxID=1314773 RepID=A0A3N2Q6S5_SODAK|nr:hypothetical protein SODALDRAFT_326640 [Sodiomyces alkalinus F11]ROT42483.1 hypothetical protein SODALDRAFT_326640 [Sodiomyces alkalinus F11]